MPINVKVMKDIIGIFKNPIRLKLISEHGIP
jgi:hypothetical protein